MLSSLLWSPLGVCLESNRVCDAKDPEKCAEPLTKGEAAPFSGQLLTNKLAIDLGQKADGFNARLKLELNFQKKLLDLDLDLEKQLRKNDQETAKQQISLLQDRLKEAHHRSWYEHPLFISAATVAATILIIIGTSQAVKLGN